MLLNDLISGNDELTLAQGSGEIEIGSLVADSRHIEKGALFCALPGTHNDGTRYISEALDRGAAAILAPVSLKPWAPPAIPLLLAKNARRALAILAARFYPKQPATIAAITGTSGKTSSAAFLRQLWSLEGRQSASLGTLGVISSTFNDPGQLTTPDPVTLHQILDRLAKNNITHVAMEASSHGLDQYRLDGVKIAAAAFTNLSHDHLDYHETIEQYRHAKERLFLELLPEGGAAILNTEFLQWQELLQKCQERRHYAIVVNPNGGNVGDIRILSSSPTSDGQVLTLSVFGKTYVAEFPVAGQFQASNLLTAMALAMGCGSDAQKILGQIERLKAVPGRIEHICHTPSGGAIYVDYAHKPAALESVLKTLRPHTTNRLVVVFGCGGDRDRSKRPEMGKIAMALADRVIVTDDNPRSEDASAIRQEILQGAKGATEIGDREEAIKAAITELGAGDVLVIAGKGHESYQIIGNQRLAFDDGDVARRLVAKLKEQAA